jgi:SET domain-containing protein
MKLKLIQYLNENKISLGFSENNSELRFIENNKGYGKFALQKITKDSIIYRVGGLWINEEEKSKFDKDYFHLVDKLYFFQGGLDPTLNGTHNHSCNPNAYLEDNTIRALRDIEINEEITIDYGTFVVHDYVILENCQCGSTDCRITIQGNDWLIHNLAKKYDNRVSSQVRRLTEYNQKNFDT